MKSLQERYQEIRKEYEQIEDKKILLFKLEELEKDIGKERFGLDKSFLMDFYSFFSVVCFDLELYSEFFEWLMVSCKYGYSILWIKDVLYQTFLESNMDTFRMNYNKNILMLKERLLGYEGCPFEELMYYVLPTEKENKFYFTNKLMDRIEGTFDLKQYESRFYWLNNEFSDVVIKGRPELLMGYLELCKKSNKKCYYMLEENCEVDKIWSMFQACVLEEYLGNLWIVKNSEELVSYLEKTGEYIPWNIIGYTEEVQALQRELTEIHKRRCLKKRLDAQPLLSICIPSYNRGKIAYENVLQILDTKFDYEAEIIFSNNGSDNDTSEYYKQLENLKDARFRYHAYGTNQGYLENSSKVADMARGKFLMLLSDEDSIYEEGFYRVLNLIKKKSSILSIIKTPHKKQGDLGIGYATKGKEAYEKYMLTSNYLSINIYNASLLRNYIFFPRDYKENKACSYYSHMCWELFVLQYGDVESTDIYLVQEGNANQNTDVKGIELDDGGKIMEYQTLEGRLEQHIGFLKIIRILDIYKENEDARKILYLKLCKKTFFLVNISIENFYGRDKSISLMQSVRDHCKKELEELSEDITEETREEIRKNIDHLYFFYINQ